MEHDYDTIGLTRLYIQDGRGVGTFIYAAYRRWEMDKEKLAQLVETRPFAIQLHFDPLYVSRITTRLLRKAVAYTIRRA